MDGGGYGGIGVRQLSTLCSYGESHLNNVLLFLECVAPWRQVMINLHEIKPTA